MKIAWFKRVITPEIGTTIAGYGVHDVTVVKTDDLYMTGLCADDGTDRVLLVSFDLIGMDAWTVGRLRGKCAEALGVKPANVLLTCTHNHTGPQTRTLARAPEVLNTAYLDRLEAALLEEIAGMTDFRECDAYFYSAKVDENRSRRYVTACNHASFTPHRREVVPIVTEYADKELGQLCFVEPETRTPLYVIGNYAAHPLAGHAPGLGSHKLSADFPGAFRDYVTAETAAECMFISGACGDLVPKEDELGAGAVRQMGENLGKAAIGGLIDCVRNPGRFRMPDARVGGIIRTAHVPIRKNKKASLPPYYQGMDAVDLEMQIVSIGDVCFVGVPGELTCELGQEIKWHSPFRRAFIAYCSTGYIDYLVSVNMMVAGGYEGYSQCMTARCGLMLLNAAADGMFELRDSLYPAPEGDCYPDCLVSPLVDVPPNR